MRYSIIIAVLLLSACGQKPAEEALNVPQIAVTRVPGVSLTYRYGFRLPPERLASVQEMHAAQCEALTPARCRITGMSYQVGRDRTINGSLAMKLAPDVARDFGKKGVATVTGQGGMLTEANIDSEESGAVVDAANRDDRMSTDEAARIQQQLARPSLPATERTQLQARLAELSDQRRQTATLRGDAQLKLASTPMIFLYASGQVDPGLNDGPLLGAMKDGWANVVAGVAVILMLAITFIPWALAAAALAAAWLGVRRWWQRRELQAGAPPLEQGPPPLME